MVGHYARLGSIPSASFVKKIVFLRSNVECPHNALAMQFQCIFLDYHTQNIPLLTARKMPENT